MALVDWSSVEQCGWWEGATNTSSIPLVRPGSNIMLRLLTLTFSQPGYRLLMLTETAGQRGSRLGHTGKCAHLLSLPTSAHVLFFRGHSLSAPRFCSGGAVCVPLLLCVVCSSPHSSVLSSDRLIAWTTSPRLACPVPLGWGQPMRGWEERKAPVFSLPHCLLLP